MAGRYVADSMMPAVHMDWGGVVFADVLRAPCSP